MLSLPRFEAFYFGPPKLLFEAFVLLQQFGTLGLEGSVVMPYWTITRSALWLVPKRPLKGEILRFYSVKILSRLLPLWGQYLNYIGILYFQSVQSNINQIWLVISCLSILSLGPSAESFYWQKWFAQLGDRVSK